MRGGFQLIVGYGILIVMFVGVFVKGFQDPTYWLVGGVALALILGAVGLGNFLGNRLSPGPPLPGQTGSNPQDDSGAARRP